MTLDLQVAATAAIVATSAAYAGWSLLPAATRRGIARRLLRVQRLPAPLAGPLQRAARQGGACGCDGCDAKPAAATPSGPVPVRLHRRPPR